MRRITLWVLGTITTLVLLFSYNTSTSSAGGAPSSVISGTASGTSDSSGASGSSSSDGSSSSSSSAAKTSAAKTYDGDSVMTQWGVVQVRITVKDGRITAADVLQVPSENHRDQEINSYAVPVLNSEVTNAQNANIDMVSGATVTSDGYIRSLQSAIDQAGL